MFWRFCGVLVGIGYSHDCPEDPGPLALRAAPEGHGVPVAAGRRDLFPVGIGVVAAVMMVVATAVTRRRTGAFLRPVPVA